MMKRWVRVFILFFFVLVQSAALAQACPKGWNVIHGKVSFQKRTTVVPLTVCDSGEPCVHSRPYWTLVVMARDGQFELDQTFAMGSDAPPRSVEVSGLEIRPGARIVLEGKVESGGDDYGIVSEVRKLEIVGD